ncbi:unnamed protein product [Arctia plantaginis]|uniref:Enolase-phosphatase E1 n=1 Tax=Arctia plantaginis TaxID=874455 RepID=A0A8S1AT99_ARCPL|nr:unnamed protein product [Arctia plantaginis]
MANEKSEINDIVKKCKILLLDIEGTTTSISFVKDKLFPYAEENVKDFLNNEWGSADVKDAVGALRKLALEDEEKKVDGVVTIPADDASKDDQIDALVKNVKWQMSSDRKVGPLKQLQGLIWKKGYDKGDIKGHVYDDVSPALEQWRSVEGRKVYIYSSGSVQAQKLLFGMSSAGDMLKLIDGHFDTAVGAKQESASYTAIAEKIGCKAEEILFLTDIDKEAEAARLAGVQAALVSREGNAPLSEAITSAYPVIYSFTELAATNKRKTDAQDQQQPAKVPKTDVETDVKTPVETSPPQSENKSEEIDKMEVEEENSPKEETAAEKLTSEAVEHIETTVEDITGSEEVSDVVVSDAKPIVIECAATKMMETEPVEVVNSVSDSKANEHNDASVSEQNLPLVITEIKDITNEKESLSEGTEIVEDLVPVVEEPAAQDMEDLQNVGEVLEKECDEILSKVQDVTNLDNIPLKQLRPIAEETMETENMDSNDIVEGILDSEQELEMKKCTDIDLNSVKDISAAKPTTNADKSETLEVSDKPSVVVVPEEKPLKGIVEEAKTEEVKEKHASVDVKCTTKEKVKETSVTEEKLKETSSPEEKVKETSSPEEKVQETSVTEEKLQETSVTEEKVQENSVTQEKVMKSSVTEEKVKETTVTEEKGEEASGPEEKVEKASVSEEKVKDAIMTEEKVKEASVTEEVKETSVTAEKVEEASVTEEKVEKAKLTEEKVKECSSKEDRVNETSLKKEKDSNGTEEKITANGQTEDKAKESSQAEENESNLKDDRVMNSCVTDGKVKDNCITEDKVKEMNVTEETLEKSNITKEKDVSSVEQKLVDGGSVSGKLEESKSIVDEVKATKENIETEMETDDSTPETRDNKISIDEKKTEDKSEREKLQIEGEKSDVSSTKLSAETNAKTLNDEISMEIDQSETKSETKPTEKVATASTVEAVQPDNDSKAVQVNGKSTNGDADMVDLNGDASKDDELSSRLSMENGKEIVNGAKGDSIGEAKTENQGDDVKENNLRKHKIIRVERVELQGIVALLVHIGRLTRLRLLPR